MSRLIAFGCSNTYGQGLPDCHLIDRTGGYRAGPNPSKHAWPGVLGKMLNRQTLNLGQPGASNKYIWHCAINFDFDPDDIVVLHWTFIYRSVALWNNKPPLHLGLWDNPDPVISEAYKKFVTTIDSDYDRMIESLAYIDHLNLYLKSKVKNIVNIVFNPEQFSDMPNWINFDFDLNAATYNIEYPLALDNSHTGMEGHRELAKDIFKLVLGKQL